MRVRVYCTCVCLLANSVDYKETQTKTKTKKIAYTYAERRSVRLTLYPNVDALNQNTNERDRIYKNENKN